jgi:hypothetical protein
MKSGVIDRDQGWGRIKRETRKAKDAGVKVGVLSDAGPHPNGPDMVLIAAANELGTDNIPARSFIRGTADDRRRDINNTKDRLWTQVLRGRLTVEQALGLLGSEHVGQIQEYMTALDTPPNAPRTIAKKGDANPLIDKGRLRRSIDWERD